MGRLGVYALICILLGMGCSVRSHTPVSTATELSDPKVQEAARLLERGRYSQSASLAWRILRAPGASRPHLDRVRYIFAHALDGLGLKAAADEICTDVIQKGGSKDLLEGCLERILKDRDFRPHDRRRLEEELLAQLEMESLAPPLLDAVQYVQGKLSYLQGDTPWSQKHFGRVRPGSETSGRLRLAMAQEQLAHDKLEAAITEVSDLAPKLEQGSLLRNDAFQLLGRLHYQAKNYLAASEAYAQITSSVLTWHEILTERAWVSYALGDHARALGYLHSLSAPSFSSSILPESYFLMGLIFKTLCHFDQVYKVVQAYRARFKAVLDPIKAGVDLRQIPHLHVIARRDPRLSDDARYLNLLDTELSLLTSKHARALNSDGLLEHLTYMYRQNQLKVRAHIHVAQETILKETAEMLMFYDEQMGILDFETRMTESGRMLSSDAKEAQVVIAEEPFARVKWPHTGEYWLDELKDIRVEVTSQCK